MKQMTHTILESRLHGESIKEDGERIWANNQNFNSNGLDYSQGSSISKILCENVVSVELPGELNQWFKL
jgi:hypothetical protein